MTTPDERYGAFSDAPELQAARTAIEGLSCGTDGEQLTRAFTEAIAAAALSAAYPLIAAAVRVQVAGQIAESIRAQRSEAADDMMGKTWNSAIAAAAHLALLAGGLAGSAASPVPAEPPGQDDDRYYLITRHPDGSLTTSPAPTTPCERCESAPIAGPSGLCTGCVEPCETTLALGADCDRGCCRPSAVTGQEPEPPPDTSWVTFEEYGPLGGVRPSGQEQP